MSISHLISLMGVSIAIKIGGTDFLFALIS